MMGPRRQAPNCQLAESSSADVPASDRCCTYLTQGHQEKLRLCAVLERIADSLPAGVDRFQCLMVAHSLVPILRACHRLEEDVVFPIAARASVRQVILTRLAAEHLEDYSSAEELTEVLLAVGHGQPVENPEAFGYMLRAFFETVRRHVAYERDHILPVGMK